MKLEELEPGYYWAKIGDREYWEIVFIKGNFPFFRVFLFPIWEESIIRIENGPHPSLRNSTITEIGPKIEPPV